IFDRRTNVNRPRGRSRNRPAPPRLSHGVKAQIDLRRYAANHELEERRTRPHHLPANRNFDGSAQFAKSETAKYPDSHRTWTRNPQSLRAAHRGISAAFGRLFAN